MEEKSPLPLWKAGLVVILPASLAPILEEGGGERSRDKRSRR